MMNSGLDKIYVKELSRQLGLTDLRSVKKYCSSNGIAMIRDIGSRSAYVIRSDYEVGRMREFIKLLKKRHGKDWLKAYQAHADFSIELLSALQCVGRNNHSNNDEDKLISGTGKSGQRFLEELNNLIG